MTKVGIVGVTGYTGMELVRIILSHPELDLAYATSRTWAGKPLAQALPAVKERTELRISLFDPVGAAGAAEVVFLCLPHNEAMDAAAQLVGLGTRVVDLSADFRLKDADVYEKWYGSHSQPQLLTKAVYGLPEIYRDRIAEASLVAVPGCYPTSVILGLLPAAQGGLLNPDSIIADSKSGVSGAGKEPKADLHFPEVEGNFSAYNIAGVHRHTCEMDQELAGILGQPVSITFSPHLIPVSRGILSTIYSDPAIAVDADGLVDLYRERFSSEPFIKVRSIIDPLPSIKDVRGTNQCIIAPRVDSGNGRIVVVSCIDNLVKGASGQAIQCSNLMLGLPETLGLEAMPLLP